MSQSQFWILSFDISPASASLRQKYQLNCCYCDEARRWTGGSRSSAPEHMSLNATLVSGRTGPVCDTWNIHRAFVCEGPVDTVRSDLRRSLVDQTWVWQTDGWSALRLLGLSITPNAKKKKKKSLVWTKWSYNPWVQHVHILHQHWAMEFTFFTLIL